MSNTFEKLARLRELYPEDVKRIEEDEKKLTGLLQLQEFSSLPVTQLLIGQCRADILFARKALATNRQLADEARAELWHIIDARMWFVKIVAKDFAGEIAQFDSELDRELAQ